MPIENTLAVRKPLPTIFFLSTHKLKTRWNESQRVFNQEVSSTFNL